MQWEKALELLRGLPLTSLSLMAQYNDFSDGEGGYELPDPEYYITNGLSVLAGMPLTSLRMEELLVTDESLHHLRGLPLTCLDIGGCRLLTDNCLWLVHSFPLTMVNVRRPTRRGFRDGDLAFGKWNHTLGKLQKAWDLAYGK